MLIDRLRKHVLVDGFHVVADLNNSEGSWVVDADTGKRYLDCYSQFASQPLGWNHPSLEVYRDYLGGVALHKMANSDMYSETYADFVDSFASICPEFEHFFFVSGGALAVENALKAAFDWKAGKNPELRDHPERMDVVHFSECFHGRSGYTMSLTNNGGPAEENDKVKWFPRFNWTRIQNPKVIHPVDEMTMHMLECVAIAEIEEVAAKRPVAAIIIEPIQGEGGDNHFRQQFIHKLRQTADKIDALLIFDEVQTGFGLTGKWWCWQNYAVKPDIMCFGKKTQVCGIAATNKIDSFEDNVFQKSGRINSTWGGNIVDMARCEVFIDIIKDEKLVENADRVGRQFLGSLQSLYLKYPKKVFNPRGKGLMLAFDLESSEERDRIYNKLMENMLVLKCGKNGIRFRPHLTFTEDDVEQAKLFIENSLTS